MKYSVIKILGLPGPFGASPYDGMYLKSYDPDRGVEGIEVTADINEAKRFRDNGEAFSCWRLQSKTIPLRDDGKPNRPLTGFSVNISLQEFL